MQYRTVGKTDLRFSEIGFGTGGNAGLMIRGTYEDQRAAVVRALELGINYFDESPDYGDGVSESNLGRILQDLGERAVITTKVEVRDENLSDIAGHVERSVEASLKRLRVDYLDVVQIHNGPVAIPPLLSGKQYNILGTEDFLRDGGALEGLKRVQRSGKTRYIGFICRGNDGPEVKKLLDTGEFDLINLVYTLLNPSASKDKPADIKVSSDFGGVIEYANERGVGVAVYSPLAGGSLTDDSLAGREPHPLSGASLAGAGSMQLADARARSKAQAEAFRFLSIPGKHSLAQAAIRFILDNSGVSTVLGGFSDLQQMEESVAASELASLHNELRQHIEATWRLNL